MPDYLPELRGSAYEGVSIRNLLEMASGVKWDETYTDPSSDRRRDALKFRNSQKPGGTLELMAGPPARRLAGYALELQHRRDPGRRRAGARRGRSAGRGLPLGPYLGAVRHGVRCHLVVESLDGLEIGGSGLSATLRDFGRLGLFCSAAARPGEERSAGGLGA